MLRLGVVDFDSSHSIEFTRRLNHVGITPEQWVDGGCVVAGCAGHSLGAEHRIPGFRAQMEEIGVPLVQHPEELLGQVDAVLILSLYGGAHLPHARRFLEAGVPVYIDKPMTCSLSDAREIAALSTQHQTLAFSSSALRFAPELLAPQQHAADWGPLLGVVTHGPAKTDPLNPGLFHYGIHATEVLFTLLGTGCTQVTTTEGSHGCAVTGLWRDGRIGTVRGQRAGHTAFGYLAFCERGVIAHPVSTRFTYRNLCQAILTSFATGVPAVPLDTTLEIVSFIEAAMESERLGGRAVSLAS